jgi:hypothetical protein
MINGFEVEFINLNLFKNLQYEKEIEENKKMWSWFWQCTKINESDSQAFLRIGQYFWNKKDKNNLRISPIEAVEMFRKSYKIDDTNTKVKLLLFKALLYRFLLGDTNEFNEIILSVNQSLNQDSFRNNPEFLYELLLVDLEAKSLSNKGFDKNLIDNITKQLYNLPDGPILIQNLLLEKKKLGILD